jgi:hypothetical protein
VGEPTTDGMIAENAPSGILTGPKKHPRLPKRDSEIDGSFPLPVALQESRGSRPQRVAYELALVEGRKTAASQQRCPDIVCLILSFLCLQSSRRLRVLPFAGGSRGSSSVPVGTEGSNPPSSSRQSVSAVNARLYGKRPALWRHSAGGWGREKGRAGCEPGLLRPFSLTDIDAVPPPASSDPIAKRHAAAVGPRPEDHLSGATV